MTAVLHPLLAVMLVLVPQLCQAQSPAGSPTPPLSGDPVTVAPCRPVPRLTDRLSPLQEIRAQVQRVSRADHAGAGAGGDCPGGGARPQLPRRLLQV